MEPITTSKPDIKKTNGEQGHAHINGEQDRQMEDRFKHIPGWGMDADPENDPTYPMKHYDGSDHQRMNYQRAPQQEVDMEVLKSIERPEITRVFGTSIPPTGVSGAIRRLAYKYSEATLAHWMGLILADRVNVVEGRIDDLKKGIIPNPWKERGWGSEWRTNKQGVVKKVAVGVLALTLVLAIRSARKKRSLAS